MKTTTNADTVETTETSQTVGDTAVHKETVVSSQYVDKNEFTIAKANQVIWLGIHLIGIVITLRFLFLLFGANINGFAALIYNISAPFVRIFQGIFPAARVSGTFFDSAALLALAIWYLFGYVVTYIVSLFSKKVTTD
jgi:hypothetical protein